MTLCVALTNSKDSQSYAYVSSRCEFGRVDGDEGSVAMLMMMLIMMMMITIVLVWSGPVERHHDHHLP